MGDSIVPMQTSSAGGYGTNLSVNYYPANNAAADSIMATISNYQDVSFENALIKFKMPPSNSAYNVQGGFLEQVDRGTERNICYVNVNLQSNGVQQVSIAENGVANEDPVQPPSPSRINGVYPNPFKNGGILEFTSHKALSNVKLEIYNIRGQKLQDISYKQIKAGKNILDLNLNLLSGIYFLKMKDLPTKAYKLVIVR
jgi:hypothetical protein